MSVLLHLAAYACVAVFVVAVVARFVQIQRYPINLRWELYPVPHEGKRAKHGGSRMEEGDWWEKPQKPDLLSEARFMLPEMIFIKALFEHNRKLWYRSFPFHFGLYILAGFIGLLILGALLSLAGATVEGGAGGLGGALAFATVVVGVVGMLMAAAGCVALIHARLTDEDLKPYTNFSHFFNLAFILAALILALAAWAVADRDFGLLRGFIASLLTFNLSQPSGHALVSLSILVGCLLIAYIPLTHMSHFFVKWFTWHKIRWDDTPNVKGGRIEVMIHKALASPVTWSAEHINADGKKNWVDIATEELKKS